jgi:hypothetical protein
VGERRYEELGGLEPVMHKGGRFGARSRTSSPLGSMSAELAGFNLDTVRGASRKRERGEVKSWRS